MIEKYGTNAGWMSIVLHRGPYVPISIAVFESSVMFSAFIGEMKLIIFLQYNLYWPQTCAFHVSYP